ncbi:MAG: 50S ribosomal protein L31e [Euryarchaeota archaeon]|jgi:large subunit ribosomal protein L31e|nr:50S ribosomal protein L31e [Euryarchaeota archaeon]MBT7938482.1 50S ribosomal protein L31e [Euryarchaeota archaeon]MDC0055465.1 50S ribosomal protein L31e [Deltaproteobacteria bacterium]
MARAAVSELVVPLRKAWNITRFKRSPRAIKIIRNEVIRHLKVREDEEIWIDQAVNEAIWKNGIENPPRKIRLEITRHDEPDIPIEVKLVEE